MIIECVLLQKAEMCQEPGSKRQESERKESYQTRKEAQARENAHAYVIAQREAGPDFLEEVTQGPQCLALAHNCVHLL